MSEKNNVYRTASPRAFTIDDPLLQRIHDVLHVIGSAPPGCWYVIDDLRQEVGRVLGDPPHPWCYQCQVFHEDTCPTKAIG